MLGISVDDKLNPGEHEVYGHRVLDMILCDKFIDSNTLIQIEQKSMILVLHFSRYVLQNTSKLVPGLTQDMVDK